jgi:hypothetical protein
LHIFNDEECTDLELSESLAAGAVSITSSVAGTITASLQTVTSGTRIYSWISYHPSYIVTMTLGSPFEIFCFVLYVICVLESLLVAIYFLKVYLKVPKYVTLMIAISNTIWAIYVIFRMVYVTTPLESQEAAFLIPHFLYMFYNIATLSTVIYTTVLVRDSLQWHDRRGIILFAGVLLIHAITAGSNYFMYYYANPISPFPENFIDTWYALEVYWTIFMFCWESIPPFLVAVIMLRARDKPILYQIKFIYKADDIFFKVVCGQAFIGLLYFIQDLVANYTDIYANDKFAFASTCFPTILLVNYQVLTGVLITRMKRIVRRASKKQIQLAPNEVKVEMAAKRGNTSLKVLGSKEQSSGITNKVNE